MYVYRQTDKVFDFNTREMRIVASCINAKCRAELPPGAVFCPRCGKKQTPAARRRRVRANGQGTVYRLPNGKWRAEKTLGYKLEPLPPGSPPGTIPKKKRVAVAVSTFATKTDALSALPFLTGAKKRGGDRATRKGESVTLKELYDLWFPTHRKGKSTMNCYAAGFRLFSPLWFTPMAEIQIDDLQDCLDDAEQGRRTRENAKTALGLVYKYGIPRNCVPKDRNLAPFLTIDAEAGSKKPGLSDAELEKVRKAAAAGDRISRLALCQCYLGFRPTAFLSLTVADYRPQERAFIGGIKTEAGIGRAVTVSPKIQPYVDELLQGRSSGQVFGAGGRELSLGEYRELFYDLLQRLGIDNPVDENGRHRLTPHSCRHTFATLMKNVSGSDADKLALIGHTSTAQLRDYQDVRFADLRAITDQL